MKGLRDLLKSTFGYASFRGRQEEIIKHVLSGNDALVLMPTGGGKSICYQLPALYSQGTAIVISPLIALMKDQVDSLKLNGIRAAFLNSSLSQAEQNEVMSDLRSGSLKLLYVSPERLFSGEAYLLNLFKELRLSLIAVDEAHCVSQWGHDFRPEYKKLSQLKKFFPSTPLMALTATADGKTQEDIKSILGFSAVAEFVSSFNRENISYQVKAKNNSRERLLEYLASKKDQSGIIYALSRKSVEQLASLLQREGYSVLPYHAGLDSETRAKHQERFIKDEVSIIVATIAFGMGIDKSNVRFVVHMDLPKNIEAYYQETGRAGRDGLDSEALLFFSRGDAIVLRRFIEDESAQRQEVLYEKLNQIIAYGDTRKCRRQFLLEYFGESHAGGCQNCDNCLRETVYFDGTEIAQKALSAVYRLEERFGTNYVIDFLRGSKSQKIKEEHTWLKTFGVGKDIPKANWIKYLRNLIDDEYLRVKGATYPVIGLGPKAASVLFKGASVQLIAQEEIKEKRRAKQELILEHKDLFEILRLKRKALASNQGLAPYQIFSDKTLVELCHYLPLELDHLLEVSGFGQIKLNRYGRDFLDPIIAYAKENNLETKITQPRSVKKKVPAKKKEASVTQLESFNLYQEGRSIEEIAKQRGLSINTIENHLLYFVSLGQLAIDRFISEGKAQAILKAVNQTQGLGLKAAKELLPDEVTYFDIKLTLAKIAKETTP